jgi:predicted ATPase
MTRGPGNEQRRPWPGGVGEIDDRLWNAVGSEYTEALRHRQVARIADRLRVSPVLAGVLAEIYFARAS